MAGLDVVTLNEVQSRLDVPQVGDNYNMPRDLVVVGDVASTTSSPGRLNVGGNVASGTGRAKVTGLEFSDGSVALTAQAISGSPNIDSVLGQGNTTLKRMTVGGIDVLDTTAFLPPITIVASDDFDNSQDSAWIDRCADKSWENEARSGTILATSNYANATAAVAAGIVTGDGYYNTTTARFEEVTGATTSVVTYRAGSRKFPMVGFVTAEAGRVIIWDSTSGQPEMWMVLLGASSGSGVFYNSNNPLSSVAMDAGIVVIGSSVYDMSIVNFVSDSVYYIGDSTVGIRDINGTIANINGTTGFATRTMTKFMHSRAINSVAITYLPDAPLDEYGMRVPTIYAFTVGGISRIAHDGSVSSTVTANVPKGFISGNKVYAYSSGDTQDYIGYWDINSTLPAGSAGTRAISAWTAFIANVFHGFAATAIGDSLAGLSSVFSYNTRGSSAGLTVFMNNESKSDASMVAYLTNTYNTGWMVGDIRRAYLCNSLTADRSVKGGALTMTGTVTETVNAGGVNVYSGFSATNYLSEAHSTNYDFGTGDFAIRLWHKNVSAGTEQRIFDIADTTYTGAHIILYFPGGGSYNVGLTDAAGSAQTLAHTITPSSTTFDFIVAGRRGGILFISVNGIEVSVAASSGDLTNTNSIMRIGIQSTGASPLTGGKIAQLHLSATAPSPEQIKHMYETERKLFEPNAKGLLSSSPNVTDLKYNKQHDTYYVKNGANVDEFKGLVRTDSMPLATGVTTSGNPLAAPVLSSTGTTNIFKAPAVDMLRDLKAVVRKPKTVLLDFNVVVNGKFSTTSGWTLGTGWSIVGGVLTKAVGTASTTTNTPTVKVGIPYVTTFTVATITAGSVRFDLGGTTGVLRTIPGTYTDTKTPTTSSIDVYGDALFAGTIDNLSIRESTNTLPKGFKPKKVWAGGLLQEEGTDYDVTFDGFLYGVNFFIEPATNIQVEGEQI